MPLTGSIRSFSLVELFQSLALGSRTGTLVLECPGEEESCPRYFYLEQGRITFVSSSTLQGFRLGNILVRQGRVTAEDVKTALEKQSNTKQTLGAVLATEGIATAEDIREALTLQVREELFDLFLLEKAQFEFHDGEAPPVPTEDLARAVEISIDPQSLLMEGLRLLDQWCYMREHLQTFDEIFVPTGKESAHLSRDQALLLVELDGRTPVWALSRKLLSGRLVCACRLLGLLDRGIVRALTVPELLAQAEEASGEEELALLTYAVQLEPGNVELRQRLAQLFREAGKPKLGVPHLNVLAKHYEKQGSQGELTRVRRLIKEANEGGGLCLGRLIRRWWRFAAIGVICVVAAAVPVTYLSLASADYVRVQKATERLIKGGEYDEAKKRLTAFIRRYSLSPRAAEAKRALARIGRSQEAAETRRPDEARRGDRRPGSPD